MISQTAKFLGRVSSGWLTQSNCIRISSSLNS